MGQTSHYQNNQFLLMSFPLYGMGRASRQLVYMASEVEHLANETASEGRATGQALTEVSAEQTMALQNRLALDYLLASQGGACAIVGQECCTYIPDVSENITNMADHIKQHADQIQKIGDEFHNYNPPGW
ncbi:hypothetical protein chiPu_0002858 [Chiloscyllium punctatum]|uniref:Uncharacterized protein n=1 Tax=Chiloscyllium punctatum TaxID=137246 RepID=A0A401S245_CHIPU|nr:hypothetical protein [Chiloscyllium punctatum]